MKRLQTRAAAAALSALLLALPTCALAAETAPLTLSTQQNAAPVERRTDLGQLSAFGRSHTYMGVSVSDEWLYQARIGGLPLGLSLFTPEGDGVTFREHLCAAQTGGKDIRLEAKGAVFRMVLRHQLFDVGQHQHAAAGQPGELGDHQAFARAGGQDNRRRLGMATEPGEGGIDGFLLVRT